MYIRSSGILHTSISIALAALVCLTANCSAQTEEQALKSLREMSRDGKLPPEAYVAGIESRFAGKKVGALAKLLHARIRLENNDFSSAAAILNTDVIAQQTRLGDYGLWLRGKALQGAGNNAEAMNVFSTLLQRYPDSVRVRDAKLLWATSAVAAGRAADVPGSLVDLSGKNDPDALLITAKAFEAQGSQPEAVKYYRRTYFFGAGSNAAKEAEARLAGLGQPLTPQTAEEARERASQLQRAGNYADAANAYNALVTNFSAAATSSVRLEQLRVLSALKRAVDAQTAFNAIPSTAAEKQEAYYQLALAFAKAKNWPQTRATIEEMKQKFPGGKWTPKAWIDVGLEARAAKNRTDEGYFLKMAVAAFPNAIEVAQAQFELAWFEHENKNYQVSSQMFTEHLARYVDKDTTNRGKAGYWAARDSELAGKTAEACALYNAVNYRYNANWYGYLATQRLTNLKNQGKCESTAPTGDLIAKAAANLKIVTVAPESAGPKEIELAAKSDELSAIGLFDWAIDELNEAKRTANNSPKINLALARHYRLKNENVNAFLALAKSYPDYAQMFPEEMGREEWDVFYPLSNWNEIKYWAGQRRLDPYQVAGLIRQESVFDPRAKSTANAYGLMQLIIPTAQVMARKYGSQGSVSVDALYQPPLNIELGTAYLRDMIDKFGRIEYVAVAYNAGPNRVAPWRASLPSEIDEFVEAIPFRETKAYVQGVIRNTAQYRRLYDENGAFRANVGSRPLRGEIDSKPRDEFMAENPDIVVVENSDSE
jgi:soluble lytic murein transglycosylase